MLKSRIQGSILLFLILVGYIYSDSYFALFLLVASLCMVLFLRISINLIKGKVKYTIKVSETINKNIYGTCILKIENNSIFPIAKAKILVEFKNILTGEKYEEEIYISVKGKSNHVIYWDLKSQYCGNLDIRLKEVKYYDYFGMFSTKEVLDIDTNTFILPNTFYMNVELMEKPIQTTDSTMYSTSKKGLDSSEIFGIKEYEQGDNSKNIHWKLSSKLDEIIIKELGSPVDNSILILLDSLIPKNSQDVLPEVLDAMVEAFVSMSKSLLENEQVHSIAWFDDEGELEISEINFIDDLSALLKDLLSINRQRSEESAINRYLNMDTVYNFTHITYITNEDAEEFNGDLIKEYSVAILECKTLHSGKKQDIESYGITFNPTNIEEDLQQVFI